MAIKRINQLPQDLAPSTSDVLAVDSAAGGTTRKTPIGSLGDALVGTKALLIGTAQTLTFAQHTQAQRNLGVQPTYVPIDYGAVGNGVTDDATAIDTVVAGMTAGSVLDGLGLTYAYSSNIGHNLPEFTTVRNAVFKLTGAAAQQMFYVRGSQTLLTYGGAAISAGATSLGSVSGLTSANVGQALFIQSNDLISATAGYFRGEMVFIESVVGTTITLEQGVKLDYTSSPTVRLLNLKRGVRFENVRFIGDPTKTQKGVTFELCADGFAEVYGENVGHYTVARLRCLRHHVQGGGNNHGINTDNGLDYFLADGNGNLQCTAVVKGHAFRHVHANGAGDGCDFDCHSFAIGTAMKDSVLDYHPGCVNPTFYVKQSGVRTGGTFSNQPIGVMVQCGGLIKGEVAVANFDTSAAMVQLLQMTADSLDITLSAQGATGAAIRGLEVQIMKSGGFIGFLKAHVDVHDLSNASSIGLNIDTNGSASSTSIGSVILSGTTPGRLGGKVMTLRTTHVIDEMLVSGISKGQAAGSYGGYFSSVDVGGIRDLNCCGHTTRGSAGTFGLRALNCSVSLAAGTLAVGVGGASLTTNALIGFTVANAAANHYT